MFAVFAKSRVKAQQKAEKDVPQCSSLDEYCLELEKKTDELFKKAPKSKISPVYTCRREAEQYLDMVAKAGTVSDAVIKAARDGGISERTGKRLIIWE